MENIPAVEDLRLALPEIRSLDFIMTGGFKAVFDTKFVDGRREALKVILLPEEDGEGVRDQFLARVLREVDVLKRCKSPYLVKLGSWEPRLIQIDGRDYLIYTEEFLDGRPVSDLISAANAPSFETVVTLTRCLLMALCDIHAMGHIHRDIKPHNIMTTRDEKRPFVVLDLGIAFKVGGTELTPPGGGPLGTPLYMAPELFRPNYKDALDIRADIYSSGVTIFEFAVGTHPLARRGEDAYTTIYRILNQRPVKLHSLRTDLPVWFCEIIDRCLKKTPALRFREPTVFLQHMESQL